MYYQYDIKEPRDNDTAPNNIVKILRSNEVQVNICTFEKNIDGLSKCRIEYYYFKR